MDGQSYSGIQGYSDKGGGGEGWTSLDYPWMVTVTLASADTLTRGGGGGWTFVDYPRMVTVTPAYGDTLTRGGEGWTSLDYPWMVTVAKYKATVSIHGWQRIVYGTIGHIWRHYACYRSTTNKLTSFQKVLIFLGKQSIEPYPIILFGIFLFRLDTNCSHVHAWLALTEYKGYLQLKHSTTEWHNIYIYIKPRFCVLHTTYKLLNSFMKI